MSYRPELVAATYNYHSLVGWVTVSVCYVLYQMKELIIVVEENESKKTPPKPKVKPKAKVTPKPKAKPNFKSASASK